MRLVSISLKHFRRFDDLHVEFSPGLNVVKGPNEAGKSTLHDAIVLGFFDRPTGKLKEQDYAQWGSDVLYKIVLTYALANGEEFVLHKDYEAQTIALLGSEFRETTWSKIQAALETGLGTTSQKLFLSTACLRQDEMLNLATGRREISTQLQSIVTGPEAEVEAVLAKLRNEIAVFERGWKTLAPRNPGPVKRAMDKLEEVEEEIARVRPNILGQERAEEEITAHKDRLFVVEQDLRTREDLQARHRERGVLIERLSLEQKEERELEERLDKVQAAVQEKQRTENGLSELSALADLSDTQRQALRDAEQNIKTRMAKAEVRQQDLKQLEDNRDFNIRPKASKKWIAPAAIVGGLMALSGLLLPISEVIAQIMLVAGGLLVITAGIGLVRLQSDSGRSVRLREEQFEEAGERVRAGKEGIEQAEHALAEILETLGFNTWEEYQAGTERMRTLQHEAESAARTLEALLSAGETRQDLEEKRKGVSRKRRDSDEKLKDLADAPELSAQEYQELVNKLEDLTAEEKTLKDQILRVEAILESSSDTIEDLQRLEERRAAHGRNLEHVRERVAIYRLVLEGVEEARSDTLRTAQDELQPRLGSYLKRLTNGRYDQATVGDDLGIQIIHVSKSEPIEVSELSRGTQDQVYFAARLALADLVFHGAKPPLLLDDPFVKFDPQRRDAALELCKDIAAEGQIILFTHHDEYDRYADNLITLS
ncbi:MAG: AAA family ATPase [Chloroflexi bacterium]|nr:AAA family ATPase [Chloroflexota bacterium]